jgi:hypothetical protein
MSMTNAVLPDPMFSDRTAAIERSLPPLLLASHLTTPDLDLKPLSHFRMQKGIHLLQEVGPISWTVFTFRPHVWGPFSVELEDTLSLLVEEGLMESHPKPLFAGFRNSQAGDDLVQQLIYQLSETELQLVRGVRKVAALAFVRV